MVGAVAVLSYLAVAQTYSACPATDSTGAFTHYSRTKLTSTTLSVDTRRYYYYLGRGQFVKIDCLRGDVTNANDKFFVRVIYARPPTASTNASCMASTTCSSTDNKCVWVTEGTAAQPLACTSAACSCMGLGDTNRNGDEEGISEVGVSRTIEFPRDKAVFLDSAQINDKLPLIFKSHGLEEVDFYFEYWAQASGTTAVTASFSFDARAASPADYFCVKPNETESIKDGKVPTVDRAVARLPRHQGFQFVIDHGEVAGNVGNTGSVGNGLNYYYYDLGRGPQIDLSCLNVYVTPTNMPSNPAHPCGDGQYGWDSIRTPGVRPIAPNASATPLAEPYDVDLVDSFDCDAYTMWSQSDALTVAGGTALIGHNIASPSNHLNTTAAFFSRSVCCFQMDPQACADQVFNDYPRNGSQACWWNPQNRKCYPADTMSALSLRDGPLGSNDSLSVASAFVHGPRSTGVVQRGELNADWTGVTNRRWFLRITNKASFGPTTAPDTCALSTMVSYESTTTGGVCEPGGRLQCDRQEVRCFDKYGSDIVWGMQYWKQFMQFTDSGSGSFGKLYRPCNCLKEKEICYRQVGCLSTKRYQLILQNCLEAGCGNFCNHED
eukprot:TRINITY_DN2324_c0_g1_i2.p1 TRINITY_DN2324_c0_g1~~TRINITY_DN2324_c0_g1_i2.p1  ORF type:complete len:607 (+),score=203.46 TRINITY_DN2324_c0_g1_i2:119-1939(+)